MVTTYNIIIITITIIMTLLSWLQYSKWLFFF